MSLRPSPLSRSFCSSLTLAAALALFLATESFTAPALRPISSSLRATAAASSARARSSSSRTSSNARIRRLVSALIRASAASASATMASYLAADFSARARAASS